MKVFTGLSMLEGFAAWFIKFYLPPMIANAMPVLVKGKLQIDKGAVFIDGKPVFGSNKTLEGLISGVVGSYIAGSAVGFLFEDPHLPLLSMGAGFAALLGDLAGAFIKRRLGLKPGEPLIPLDQLDFALASTAFYYVTSSSQFTANPMYIVAALVLIFVLHVATNYTAYLLGLKQAKL